MTHLPTNSSLQSITISIISIISIITNLLLLSHVSNAFLVPPQHYAHPSKTTQLYLDGEGMAGKTFNKHLLGDILRSLQPRYLDQMKQSITQNLQGATKLNLDSFQTYMMNTPPTNLPKTWKELSKIHQEQCCSSTEKSFRQNLQEGSIPSALRTTHTVRINPQNPLPSNIQVTFYKDSASWCPYCQKAWIALEEMNLSYHIQTVDMNCYAGTSKPSEFLQIQPSGNLPCIVLQNIDTGKRSVMTESKDVLFEFPQFVSPFVVSESESIVGRKGKVLNLVPKGEEDQEERIRYLCNDGRNSLERRLFAEWMWYLTGKRKPIEYRERYETMLDEVNQVLSESDTDGPYFMGSELSVVDIQFIPFVERQVASLAYFKGFHVRDSAKWPYLVKWLEAMEQRESYQHTKSDFYTHSRSLPPQLSGGCSFYDGCEDYRDSIDAYSQPISYFIDQCHDEASLQQYLSWTEPGWDNDIPKARREAAERIIYNHEDIIQFAARAAGTPGLPAASAPLADPRAISNMDATEPIDLLLRHVVQSLLLPEKKDTTDWDIGKVAQALRTANDGTTEHPETVMAIVKCLDYLRARIGVPRDMSYPAARELKKELLIVSSLLMDVSIPGISSNVLMKEKALQ